MMEDTEVPFGGPREGRPRSPRPRGSGRNPGSQDHPGDGRPSAGVLRGGV